MDTNIVVALFDVESEAYQAFAEISRTPLNQSSLISQMALIKKEYGRIIVKQHFDTGRNTTDDTWKGTTIGLLAGILGGPLGILLGGSMGALIGSTIDAEDVDMETSMIEHVATHISEGELAIIILVEEADLQVLNAEFKKFTTKVIRFDAVDVLAEVEKAQQLQREMAKQAKQDLKQQKINQRKEKIESRKKKISDDFSSLKERIKNDES